MNSDHSRDSRSDRIRRRADPARAPCAATDAVQRVAIPDIPLLRRSIAGLSSWNPVVIRCRWPNRSLTNTTSRPHRRAATLRNTATKTPILHCLQRLPHGELVEAARAEGVEYPEDKTRSELVVGVIKMRLRQNGMMYGEGTLEILPDGYGFLAEQRIQLPGLYG